MTKLQYVFLTLVKISFLLILIPFKSYGLEQGIPVQLRLKDPSGNYPTQSGLSMRLQVLSPTGGCILREEIFSSQTVVNGNISLVLGSGARGSNDPSISLNQLYENKTVKTGLTCVNASNVVTGTNQSYTPVSTDGRIMRLTTVITPDTIVADFNMRSAPYAIQAESVGGKLGSDILVQNVSTQVNQTNLEFLLADNTRFNNLKDVALNSHVVNADTAANATNAATAITALTATNFSGNLSGDVTGTQSATVVGKLRGVAISNTAPTLGQVLVYNGSQYVPTTPVTSAPVQSVNGKTGFVVLTASDISGVATSATSLLGDVTGQLSATVVSNIGGKTATQVSASVDATSSATTSPVANTLARRDGSGNLLANSVLSTSTSTQSVYIFDATNTNSVRIKSAASFSDYILTLPISAGSNGQILQTDGSGNLSWVTQSSGGITSINVTAPIVSTGGSSPTLSISQASSSTNGYLSSADYVTFSNKQNALGYTPLNAASDLSDLTSSATARINLGLGGAAVLNVGTTSGTVAAGDDARIVASLTQAAFNAYVASANCTAFQTLYWNSVSSAFTCQNAQVAGDIVGNNSAVVVQKIQGVGVSFTGLANNNILQYNGSDFVNVSIPTCLADQFLTFDGANYTCASSAASVTSVNGTAGQIAATGSSTVTVSLVDVVSSSTVGSANSVPSFSYDTKGRITAATAFSYQDATASVKGVVQVGSNLTISTGVISVTSGNVISALGYTPADNAVVGGALIATNNLSDLVSSSTARTNLGLAGAAVLNVGTTTGTVAAGDDTRITGALQQTAFNTYVASASCSIYQTMYWNSVGGTFACQNITTSGDVTGIASATVVGKIQGVGVSFTSLANNNILQYNGSQFVNRAIPTCSAGQYITFNGTTWSCVVDAGGGGSITSISVTAPISSTGGATPVLSIAKSTAAVDGYLAAADFTTFNNKVNPTSASVIAALGYTPLNAVNNLSDLASSATARTNLGLGALATKASVDLSSADATGTLAIARLPAFAGDLTSVAASNTLTLSTTGVTANTYGSSSTVGVFTVDNKGRITSASSVSLSSLGAVTSVSGSAPLSSTGGTNPVLSIAKSTAAVDGYLAAADFTTFNNKVNPTSASVIAALGYTPLNAVNNLSDVASATVARTNLGLGALATKASVDLSSADATGTLATARLPAFAGDLTSVAASNTLTLNTTGVISGTYTKVAVDTKGRVTSGTQLTSSDVTTALGFTPANNAASGTYLTKSNNLSDLVSSATARTNLGLAGAAVLNVGTTTGTVAAGDDTRITGALQQTAFNTYVASASCSIYQTMYWNSVSSTFACQNITTSGDVTGIASATVVGKIQGVGVSFTSLANNNILQYNGTNIINRAIPTCAVNQYLTFNGAAWSCATDIGSAGFVTNVSSANSYITVATSSTTPVLTLNVGTAINTVAAGNDTRIVNALQTSTVFAGDVSGTYNNLVLANSGVTAGTYTKVTVDAKGRVTTGASITSADVITALTYTPVSNTLTSANIYVGNGSNVATGVALSGDATINNTGVLTLKNTGTAGTYGVSNTTNVITTDAQGRVTAVTPTTITIVASQVSNFAATVLATVLPGFSAATATTVLASDTILAALGKLQGQLNTILNPATTQVVATGNITTTSTTDVLVTGMTITPAAGTYQVYFMTSVSSNTNGGIISTSIYAGGTQVAASITQSTPQVTAGLSSASLTVAQGAIAEVTVNGSQAIEARWNISTGTGTARNRSLMIHRVR